MKEIVSLAYRQLKLFFKNNTLLFMIAVIALILSTLTMLFVVVRLDTHSDMLSDGDLSMKEIVLDNTLTNISVEEAHDHFDKYLSEQDDVDYILAEFNTEELYITCFIDRNQEDTRMIVDSTAVIEGRSFEREELESGKDLIITVGTHVDNDLIRIKDIKYSVIGELSKNGITNAYIPMNSAINSDLIPSGYKIVYKKDLTPAEMKANARSLKNVFSKMKVTDAISVYQQNGGLYLSSENLILMLMATVSVISCAYIYSYIISKRTNDIYAFKICGARTSTLVAISIAELMMIFIIQFIGTILLFLTVMFPLIKKNDVIFSYGFSAKHIVVSAVIILLQIIMTFLPYLTYTYRKSVIELKQKRK